MEKKSEKGTKHNLVNQEASHMADAYYEYHITGELGSREEPVGAKPACCAVH